MQNKDVNGIAENWNILKNKDTSINLPSLLVAL
jgi:hypothetical protein